MKNLFCGKKHSKDHIIMLVQFTCIINMYFIALYNSSLLNGNILIIGIFFSCSEMTGIIFGERLMLWFHPIKALFFCITLVLIMTTLIKTVPTT